MSLDLLTSIRRTVTPIAFDVYDKQENVSLLPRVATIIDNRQLQEDPVTLEWVGEFFQMRPWLDEKTTQRVVRGDFTIPIKAYEVTVHLNRKKLKRPNGIASAIPLADRMAAAFSTGKMGLAASVLRSNPLAYDGQNLFDTDHVHPDGQGSYSNVLAPNWVDPAQPTIAEAKALLHEGIGRLLVNRAITQEIVDTELAGKDLVVIVHNVAHQSIFRRIQTMEKIDNLENELRGTFVLFQDMNPTSGQENYIEIVYSPPNGPRPILFVVDEEPSELKVDDSSEFKNLYVAMGMEAFYGVKPGWPQTALQVRPT
jgi:Mu-like prophage major head subunit gpT